jgi:hypothetical protein
MAQGGEAGQEAFETLGKKSAAILVNELTNGTKNGAAEIERILTTEVPDGVEFGITTTFDGSQIFNAFYQILQNAEEVKKVLGSLGYDVSAERLYEFENIFTGQTYQLASEEEAKKLGGAVVKTGRVIFKSAFEKTGDTALSLAELTIQKAC